MLWISNNFYENYMMMMQWHLLCFSAYHFQENLLRTMIQIENTYFELGKSCIKNCLIICDRGVMDASACEYSFHHEQFSHQFMNWICRYLWEFCCCCILRKQTFRKINGKRWQRLMAGMRLNYVIIVTIKLFIWFRLLTVPKTFIRPRWVLVHLIIDWHSND